MDKLKKHLPFSGQEGLHEIKKVAERFEEKIYTAATSQVLPYFYPIFSLSLSLKFSSVVMYTLLAFNAD